MQCAVIQLNGESLLFSLRKIHVISLDFGRFGFERSSRMSSNYAISLAMQTRAWRRWGSSAPNPAAQFSSSDLLGDGSRNYNGRNNGQQDIGMTMQQSTSVLDSETQAARTIK
eukprot:scaffold43994_cov66-Cyclotella_meneghiniana.AAC.2